MKSSICIALAAVMLGACTKTIIEKPVVERETVIERPVVAATPAPGTPLRACSFAGTTYSHGAASCQGQSEYRCSDGAWVNNNSRC